jgi:hypothetical protein
MYGAWDQATANATSPGQLFQLRALVCCNTRAPLSQHMQHNIVVIKKLIESSGVGLGN